MFDLSPLKLLVLAVLALIVFGPKELPKIASQVGRALRDLRRIAEGAKADLKEGLGPEFQDFDFEDLNPRRFVQKHLLEEPVTTGAAATVSNGVASQGATANGSNGASTTTTTNGASGATAVSDGRTLLQDGADPPFDIEAT